MNKIFTLAAGLSALLSVISPSFGQTILPNDDVYVETSADGLTTTTYNGYASSAQVNFGLAAANGVASGRRRSFIKFTIGPDPVTSATFMIYNYWGANMGGGGNLAGSGSLRLRATPVGTPITITEPAMSLDTTWVPPTDADFNTTLATINVSTVGWQSIDVTSWYNARLGQTTTLQLHGVQVSGFDFPIYEDRENSAFIAGADNTLANTGPRLELVPIPEPAVLSLVALGGGLLVMGRRK